MFLNKKCTYLTKNDFYFEIIHTLQVILKHFFSIPYYGNFFVTEQPIGTSAKRPHGYNYHRRWTKQRGTVCIYAEAHVDMYHTAM